MIQITSTDPNKQCDFFPFGSLHDSNARIHFFCEFKEVEVKETKNCPKCGKTFPINHPFCKSNDVGAIEMCVRCYGKNHCVARQNYYNAIREEILIELREKGVRV